MINLFNFSSGDLSIGYLNQIFGSMNGIIPGNAGSVNILSTMFKTFNSVILAVGALVVLYVTIVGVMKTAHEGEFMGKNWNNLWIPIRTVIGIAALVPTGSGYSAIQLVMMWVIIQGIGAADTLWNTVLSYVNIVGSPYGTVTVPTVGVQSTLSSLFQSITCDVTARESRPDFSQTTNGSYYCATTKDSWCSLGAFTPFNPNADVHSYSMGPQGGQCGILTYCDSSTTTGLCAPGGNAMQCATCQGQVQALAQIIPLMANIAVMFEQVDYSYRAFYYTSATQPKNSSWSWMNSYCNAQTPPISPNQCCNPQSKNPNNICKAPVSTSGVSPWLSPNDDNNNPQSSSTNAVNNLYWPYAISPQLGGANFISTSVTEYTNDITAALTTYIQSQGQSGNVGGTLSSAQSQGWMSAGAYYYAISESNNKMEQSTLPSMTISSNVSQSQTMNNFRNNYTAAGALVNVATGASSSAIAGANPQLSGVSSALGATNSTVSTAFGNSLSSSGGPNGPNPLAQLAITGTVFLLTVEITFIILLAVTFLLGILGNISFFVVGTGEENPVGPAMILVYIVLIPMTFGLLGILSSLGATLGVYVPLIPYVVFTFGAIGWLIQVMEAMVAGPLVALGILSPSGQHELLGKAEPALMLLFDVFLRPSLMIFGLVAAMLLAIVVVSFINGAFWTVVIMGIGNSMGNGGYVLIYANPLELIIFLSAYISLIVAALNKCFAAIYIIPQGVMKWISSPGGAAYGGEAEALGGVEKGVSGAAAGVKGGVEAGAGAKGMGSTGGMLVKKHREHKKGPTTSGS